jgi:hypothetical protein
MSNISFITTRARVSSYNITELLSKINDKRFDGKMTITEDESSWKVQYKNDWDTLNFYQPSPRKLSLKHPHTPWMGYVAVVFRNELGVATQALLSDEGVGETWKPNPKKYPTYKAWLDILHGSLKEFNLSSYKDLMRVELSMAPKGMKKY